MLILLLALHIVAALCIALLVPGSGDWAVTATLGTFFSQISLGSTWAALGPSHLSRRLPIAALLAVLSWLAMVGLFYRMHLEAPGGGMIYFTFVYAGIAVGQWLTVLIPLAALRAIFGWRMVSSELKISDDLRPESQFGIIQLLIWTTGIAVVLGLSRLILSRASPDGWDPDTLRDGLPIFGLLILSNLLVVFPPIWACSVQRRVLVWILAAGGTCAAVTFTEHWVYNHLTGDSGFSFWWFNGVQFLWFVGSLLLLRAGGYRLVIGSASTEPQRQLT